MNGTREILRALAIASFAASGMAFGFDPNAVKDMGDAIPTVEGFKDILGTAVAAQRQPKTRALGRQAAKPKGFSSSAIDFAFGSDRLTERSRKVLTNLSSALSAVDLNGVRLEIVGHTDAVGADAYNVQLSRKRAVAVMNFLARNSAVPAQTMEAVGVGKQDLKDPEHPDSAVNRRVEVLAARAQP
jgi:outer membrane protein OmpA-like peptidoglycan-associated protein